MRGTFVYRGGKLVEKGGPQDVRIMPPRSDLPCPMLVSDIMEPVEHVDGSWHTSKSGYRRVTKANGLIEVGNEKLNPVRPKVSRAERAKGINDAVERAAARVLA